MKIQSRPIIAAFIVLPAWLNAEEYVLVPGADEEVVPFCELHPLFCEVDPLQQGAMLQNLDTSEFCAATPQLCSAMGNSAPTTLLSPRPELGSGLYLKVQPRDLFVSEDGVLLVIPDSQAD